MKNEFETVLKKNKKSELTSEDALGTICGNYADLGYAKVDLQRQIRQGMPEVVYGEGKTANQISEIAKTMVKGNVRPVLITRLSPEKAEEIGRALPLVYHPEANLGHVGKIPSPDGIGKIVVACGGTSDVPVAEEAALTCEIFGSEVVRLYDVGVAGLHRLLSRLDEIRSASVVIAVAGMEGALASVIGGLVSCPVIAVPTSVGYGASFGGLSALLSMLNSCSPGVAAVNIDNGFGAGFLASRINHMGVK